MIKFAPLKDMNTEEKINAVLFHIDNVRRNCNKIGLKLISSGEIEIGRMLISNGQIHDNSKLSGIEFEHLFVGDPLLPEVASHHAKTNPHHPEFWGSIHKMPEVYIAEMVCDCAARGSEFGTDVRKWFSDVSTVKYGFSMDDPCGILIQKYLDLLLTKPFKQ